MDRRPMCDKSGIYQVSSEDCDLIHIGQTKRCWNIKFKEHLAHLKHNRFDKWSVAHMLDNKRKVRDMHLVKAIDNKI